MAIKKAMRRPLVGLRLATTKAWRRIGGLADKTRWLAVVAFMLLPLPLVLWIHRSHLKGVADPIDLAMDYLKATGILLLLSGLFIGGHWLVKKQSGYVMLPFLDATKKEFNGQAISEELTNELQRISPEISRGIKQNAE